MNAVADKQYPLAKKRDGWEAETRVRLAGVTTKSMQLGGRSTDAAVELRLTTGKSSRGGLSTTASVVTLENGIVTFVICGDYTATVLHEKALKCTEKNVRLLHESNLPRLNDIEAAARQFYGLPAGHAPGAAVAVQLAGDGGDNWSGSGVVLAVVSAADRAYRLNVKGAKGEEWNEIAPECVRAA